MARRDPLRQLIDMIVARDVRGAKALLATTPALARASASTGATRTTAAEYFYEAIAHYLSAGDTALHMAAAAQQATIAKELLARGADPRATNRRAAQPLHYAVDSSPDFAHHDERAQVRMVTLLIEAGADVDARDAGGVTPLHRAVRNRCAAAVTTLLEHGASVRLANSSGSTPLHLAVQNTGRGGSGSAGSKRAQRDIVRALLEHGASPRDADGRGKSVRQAATSDWLRELLAE